VSSSVGWMSEGAAEFCAEVTEALVASVGLGASLQPARESIANAPDAARRPIPDKLDFNLKEFTTSL
jgi:hypothetical protein